VLMCFSGWQPNPYWKVESTNVPLPYAFVDATLL
jgi:hypothetical protein